MLGINGSTVLSEGKKLKKERETFRKEYLLMLGKPFLWKEGKPQLLANAGGWKSHQTSAAFPPDCLEECV